MKIFSFAAQCLVIGFLFCSCAKMPIAQSSWQAKKPDLHNVLSINDGTGHLQGSQNILFSISNDSTNLYIKLMVADAKTQMKILRNGMKLWLDTTGHQKEKLGIIYPLSSKDYKLPGERRIQDPNQEENMRDKNSQNRMKQRLILRMIEMDIVGFDGPEAVRVPALTNAGLGAALQIDSNGVLHYSAIIPFKLMHYNPTAHMSDKSKPFTVGIQTERPEPQGSHGDGGGGGRGGNGGGGGMGGGGGGMHGGGGGGRHGGGGQSAVYEDPIDLWMQVKLANK